MQREQLYKEHQFAYLKYFYFSLVNWITPSGRFLPYSNQYCAHERFSNYYLNATSKTNLYCSKKYELIKNRVSRHNLIGNNVRLSFSTCISPISYSLSFET